MSKEKWTDAKQFARRHWPVALAATLTISGAATWLLIRYYKEHKTLTKSARIQLDVLEGEAVVGQDETAVMLETGATVVGDIPGSHETAAAMAESIPDQPGQDAMSVLGHL